MTDSFAENAGTTFRAVLGSKCYKNLLRQVRASGATEEDLNKGFFMLPFQAAYFTERIPNSQRLAHFIKSIAIQWSTKRFNKALYVHFKANPIETPLLFTIARPVVISESS